jgi:hypothetical protein
VIFLLICDEQGKNIIHLKTMKTMKTMNRLPKTAELIIWCPCDTNTDVRIREVRKTHTLQEDRGRAKTVPLEAGEGGQGWVSSRNHEDHF